MQQQVVVVNSFGGSEVLELVSRAVALPGKGEVRVRVLAAGVAYSDIWMRSGRYPNGPKPPFTPGYDIYGVVDALGADVANLEVGQPVAALTVTGGYAEYLTLPANLLVPTPPDLDPAEAVTLVQSYLTAYQMLHRLARVAAGERALVHGGGGAVGLALLQLGRLAGLELYATVSPRKQALVVEQHATPIDYTHDDFVAGVRQHTGDGVDVVFDQIGGPHLGQSLQALRASGRVIAYGFHVGQLRGPRDKLAARIKFLRRTRFDPLMATDSNQGIFAFNVTTLRMQRPDWYRSDLQTLLGMLVRREIVPYVADRLPLGRSAEAHSRLERAEVAGKLVLIPTQA